jgi:hypothetical protein
MSECQESKINIPMDAVAVFGSFPFDLSEVAMCFGEALGSSNRERT